MTDENLRPSVWSPRNLLIGGTLLAVAFLTGFLWQWTAANSARDERDELQRQLTFAELENDLAAAVIQAEQGSYEGARQLMSGFFTQLEGNVSDAPADATTDLRQIQSRRDVVITGLSRSDPESANLLTRIYMRYQSAMGGPDIGTPIPSPEGIDSPDGGTPAAPGESGEGEPRGPRNPAR